MIQSRMLIPIYLLAGAFAAAQSPAPLPPLPPQAPQAPQALPPPLPPQAPPALLAKPGGYGIGIGDGAGYGGYSFHFAQPQGSVYAGRGNEDGLYQRAQTALDNHRWQEAFDGFTEVIARGGSRVEGALYWKAYALNKLGRRDEALAAIAELRKSYAGSRWLEDAKVLEMETRQAS